MVEFTSEPSLARRDAMHVEGGIQAAAEILERSICKFAWTYDSEKL